MFCLCIVGTEQVKGAAPSDTTDHCASCTVVDSEGPEAEGCVHGDEQIPQRGTELRCRMLVAVR